MQVKDYFQGKVCIVTGAASGIGFAVSKGLAEVGAVVVLADRNAAALTTAQEKLSGQAGRVFSACTDVTDQEQVRRLIGNTDSEHGRIDLLFNNAGVGATLPIQQASIEHWRRVIDINLWGVIYGVDAALPVMLRQGHGHIVNTASVAGIMPFPYQAIYAASKYAVAGLTECLRLELEPDGIAFSVVCPGDVATPIYGTNLEGEQREVKPPPYAIPADDAARFILEGVANKESMIVFPEHTRQLWRQYCNSPESLQEWLREMASQRRSSIESGQSYFAATKVD
jgi:NAD(P)-dependent dehydrogenase (short-subunit alcohol dehydrogenase family)